MKTINVSISEKEARKFRLSADRYNFSELIEIIRRELARQNLNKGVLLAEKYGLSKMTMKEISDEVTAVRKYEKDHS